MKYIIIVLALLSTAPALAATGLAPAADSQCFGVFSLVRDIHLTWSMTNQNSEGDWSAIPNSDELTSYNIREITHAQNLLILSFGDYNSIKESQARNTGYRFKSKLIRSPEMIVPEVNKCVSRLIK